MYNEILPMFKQLQIERNISVDEGFFAYPKCYLAVADATTGHYVIIMENLKISGYELWDKMKPVDFDTSSIFLASLGRFHALSFALREQKPELFQKLIDLEDVVALLLESPNMLAMMTSSIDTAIEYLISEDEKNLLKKIKENCKSVIGKKFPSNSLGNFRVLSHGDCWNNNFCFLSDENVSSSTLYTIFRPVRLL